MARQEDFSAGELHPRLHAKEGHPAFGRGLERARNVIVTPEGDVVSRPGTEYLGQPVPGYGTGVVWVRFTRATGVHYLAVFTNLLMTVLDANGGVVRTLDTAYTTAQLSGLRFLTSGDYLYVFHVSHAHRRVVPHDGSSGWALVEMRRPTPDNIYDLVGVQGKPGLLSPLPTPSATHPARRWRWKVTEVGRLPSGRYFETSAVDVDILVTLDAVTHARTATSPLPDDALVACYPDKPVSLTWFCHLGMFQVTTWEAVAVRVYRGDGTLYGLVGEARTIHNATSTAYASFVDVGAAPNFAEPPPLGMNPLEVRNGTGALVRTEEAVCGAFHQERLVLAGTAERPDAAFFSVLGDYDNFDRHTPGVADMAVDIELPARTRERIRHALAADRALFLFTDAQVWAVESDASGFAYDNFETNPRWAVGAGETPPLRAGRHVVFETRAGRVSALVAGAERGSYVDVDLTSFAEHVFDEAAQASGLYLSGTSPVVSMAFQMAPWPILWVVLRDGRLASLTLDFERKVRAWTVHETQVGLDAAGLVDGKAPWGIVRAVEVLPGAQEDAVFLIVDRPDGVGAPSGKRCLERMTAFRVPDGLVAIDRPGLDSFTTLNVTAGVPAATPAHLFGNGWPLSALTVQGVEALPAATTFTLQESSATTRVGLPFTSTVSTLRLRGTAGRKVAAGRLFLDVYRSRGLWYGPTGGKLVEALARTVAQGYEGNLLTTERLEVLPHSTWERGARVTLEQRQPYPFVLTGLEREVTGGG